MKEQIRQKFLLQRKGVTKERREAAKNAVLSKLIELARGYSQILTYSPLPDEVDITLFNRFLEKENRLSLPKIIDEHLIPYSVTSMEKQLKTFSHRFLEPDFSCPKTENIDLVVVPGLVFDKKGRRVGFGKGHYDKFLEGKNIPTVGVCFKEQVYEGELPQDKHDIPMEMLCIV